MDEINNVLLYCLDELETFVKSVTISVAPTTDYDHDHVDNIMIKFE